MNIVFFSDSTGESGKHRVGWAMSSAAEAPLRGSWDEYWNHCVRLEASSVSSTAARREGGGRP